MWSLGWHACSYAYSTQELLEENIKGYKSNKFPLEGVWLDIDYTNDYDIFTVNTTAFPTIKALTTQLQADGKKVIPIVDAGLNSHDAQNKYYSDAFDKNLLLKSTANADMENGILTTKIFSNDTVFLDFFDDRSKDVWGEGLRDLHALIPYDGIWLDMNEPVSFCNGECPQDATESTAPTKEQVIKDKLVNLFDGEILNKTWFY
jgi:alpha-glucosidase (family GH31 glycosyl hydrolase)